MNSAEDTTARGFSQHDRPTPRLQPMRALRALNQLRDNPDDTAQVFTIIEALSGRAPLRVLARFRKDEAGRALLRDRPNVLSYLSDRAMLESLPRDSLGRAYLAFLDREGITAEGLVGASVEGRRVVIDRESDFSYMRDRMRDTHDLWHTVTGYQGDVIGETALLGFNVAQLRNPGVATIVLAGLANLRSVDTTKVVVRAFRDGLRAAWLPPLHWEVMLPLPLAQVRATLRIPPVPAYTPLRTKPLASRAQPPSVAS